jgi:hypothetical protein
MWSGDPDRRDAWRQRVRPPRDVQDMAHAHLGQCGVFAAGPERRAAWWRRCRRTPRSRTPPSPARKCGRSRASSGRRCRPRWASFPTGSERWWCCATSRAARGRRSGLRRPRTFADMQCAPLQHRELMAQDENRDVWWCRSGGAAASSPAASRTSGTSAPAPSADHAGLARTAKREVNGCQHPQGARCSAPAQRGSSHAARDAVIDDDQR